MSKEVKNSSQEYSAKDIYVLEGLDPVRKRPGMYIGSTGTEGLHHLLWEVVDNGVDEAIAGYATKIKIFLHKGNRVEVEDNGRGIPIDIHAQTKKSALETVVTTLHAGGKFGGKAYKVSGGLHGVGISVVCALSKWMMARVKRDGFIYQQEYGKGKVLTKVIKTGKTKETGTTIIFDPDPEIFSEIKFDAKKILTHLRHQAYLTKGLEIKVVDERDKFTKPYTFYFEGGILSYLRYLTRDRTPRHENIFYVYNERNEILVEAGFRYTEEYECYEESFANNIFTPEGGTHLTGFRGALTRAFNDYARKNNFLKEKEENLTGEDIREGLTAVISIKIREPQFEGQTKAKLGNPEAKSAVEAVVSEAIKDFLERNPNDARAIVEKCVLSQKARKAAKMAKETILRKGILEGMALPGKLADCSSRNAENSELFIVEGDSAGGSCKSGRDRSFQAVLPLRGKILNIEKARLDKILSNREIKSLIIALGTSIGDDFDIKKLRYDKIIIMCDADCDGNHIRTLLLTLFYRYFRQIVEQGHLYVAHPPLYKIHFGKEVKYFYSEEEKDQELKKLKAPMTMNVQRYKGLGEMNPEELWETTINPEKRVLLKIMIDDAQEADKTFDILMGDEVLPRKKFIQTYAMKVKNLDI